MSKITITAIENLKATLTFENGTSISLPIKEIPDNSKIGDELYIEFVNKDQTKPPGEKDAKKILNELLSK